MQKSLRKVRHHRQTKIFNFFLGTIQELKEKLEAGYVLEMKLSEAPQAASSVAPVTPDGAAQAAIQLGRVMGWVHTSWPHAELAESFESRLQFRIPKIDVPSLGRAFALIGAGYYFFFSIPMLLFLFFLAKLRYR